MTKTPHRADPSVSPLPFVITRIALGRWSNQETFWKALVENKRLVHLGTKGHPASNPLRDRLALGDEVFHGISDLPLAQQETAIVMKTAEVISHRAVRRIYFDITAIESSAKVFQLTSPNGANGFFARVELQMVLEDPTLLAKTYFFEHGTPLWRNGESWWHLITRQTNRPVRLGLLHRRKQLHYLDCKLRE